MPQEFQGSRKGRPLLEVSGRVGTGRNRSQRVNNTTPNHMNPLRMGFLKKDNDTVDKHFLQDAQPQ